MEIGATLLENRLLRKIFVSERKKVTGEWRQLQVGELLNIYAMPDVIRAISSRRTGWVGHAARMVEKCDHRSRWGSLEETDRLEEPFVSGKIILRLILRK
jgi:hypothetical protein